MKKASICLLLVFSLMAALVSGCASQTNEPAAEPSATAVESEAPATEDAAPSDAPDAEAPATESAEPLAPSVYPLTDELYDITWWQAWPPFLATFCEPQDCFAFAELEAATNVHLDVTWVDTETSSEKFNLVIAGGDYPNLMQGATSKYTGGGSAAIEEEIMYDLWPYVQQYMPNFMNRIGDDQNIRRSLLDDDGQMAAIMGLYTENYYTDQGTWIRSDMLEKVGLEVPTTLAETEAVLDAFKNQLGMSDPFCMLAEGNLQFLATAYDAGTLSIDGQLVDNSLGDNMKNYLKKMNEWYEKGYVYSDFLANSYSDTKPPEEKVYHDQTGMFNEDIASISTYVKNSDNADFWLEPVPQMLLEEGQELKTRNIPKLISDKYTVSVTTSCDDEKLEIALRMMDYMFGEEGRILGNYGVEGETWEYDDGGSMVFTDFIMNHQLGYQGAVSAFINPGMPCVVDQSVNELAYNDEQKRAVEVFISSFTSDEYSVPSFSMTSDETSETATLQTDIDTYTEEMRLKFITGEADIDSSWDEYVETVKSMGYDEILEIKQGAYERYLAK